MGEGVPGQGHDAIFSMDFELCLPNMFAEQFYLCHKSTSQRSSGTHHYLTDIPKSNLCHDAKREGGPRSNVIMILIL